MKKIRKTAILASLLTAIGFGLAGCEWESPGDNEYWSDSYNWVNFSGVYKNPNGGSVVTDFTSAVTTNVTGGTVVPVDTTIATGNGGSTYSGSLLPNVVPGSLQITAGGVIFTDNGTGLLIPSTGLATMGGSISYGSGAWGIDVGGVLVASGSPITAHYSVYQSAGGGSIGGGGTASKHHGTTGVTILSLTAIQEGNLITLIDSDGMSYPGKMGSIRSASGNTGTTTTQGTVALGISPRAGDVVIAQFTCNGTSRAGAPVEIVGLFQGTIIVEGGINSFVMSARSIQGQWVEKYAAGKIGEVIGMAKEVAINWVSTGSGTGAP